MIDPTRAAFAELAALLRDEGEVEAAAEVAGLGVLCAEADAPNYVGHAVKAFTVALSALVVAAWPTA